MLIDWFTIIAQIINFLILLFLLKRFLYGPIIAAMDAREQRVVSRLEEAHAQQEAAEQQAAAYRQKQHELEQQRTSLLHDAEELAHQRRQELLAAARTEADQLTSGWRTALEQSKTSFLHGLRQRTGEQVMAVARRVLRELANADLEQHIVTVFLQRLRQLDHETCETIEQAFDQAQQTGTIHSAFDLTHDQRRQITEEIREQFSEDVDLSFETTSELIAGLALTVGGHEIAWNVQSYLETLEEEIKRVFAQETHSENTTPDQQLANEQAQAEYELVEE